MLEGDNHGDTEGSDDNRTHCLQEKLAERPAEKGDNGAEAVGPNDEN